MTARSTSNPSKAKTIPDGGHRLANLARERFRWVVSGTTASSHTVQKAVGLRLKDPITGRAAERFYLFLLNNRLSATAGLRGL